MVGGDSQTGRAALYLGDGFYQGSSSKASSFDNEMLSGKPEFSACDFEVWHLYV